MEYKALKDIAKITMGQSPDSSSYNEENDGLPFFQGNADFGDLYPNERVWCSAPKKVAEPGDILISVRAPIGALNYAKEKCCIGRGLAAITIEDEAERNYVFHLLKARNNDLNAKGTGSTFKAIGKSVLEEVSVPQISREEQQICMDMMDLLESIIRERQSQLNKLEDLIRARFVEIFGDPSLNPFGWEKVKISTVLNGKPSNGFFAKRDDYVDDGNVAVLGVAYVVNRMYSQVYDLPRTNADDNDIKKYSVKYGDMLFCRSSLVAAGIGKASIVPEDAPEKTLFECHVIRLPLDLEKCIPEFMQVLSTTDYFRNQMVAQSKTATMTTIGQDGIMKATIIKPPIEKQREFYSFVKQVDKSKAVVKKSLDEVQLLFDSLMQQYFG